MCSKWSKAYYRRGQAYFQLLKYIEANNDFIIALEYADPSDLKYSNKIMLYIDKISNIYNNNKAIDPCSSLPSTSTSFSSPTLKNSTELDTLDLSSKLNVSSDKILSNHNDSFCKDSSIASISLNTFVLYLSSYYKTFKNNNIFQILFLLFILFVFAILLRNCSIHIPWRECPM